MEVSCVRETEEGVIKIPDLMLLNKDTDRKFELGGGFGTDPKSFALDFSAQDLVIVQFSRPSPFPGGSLRPGPWEWIVQQKGERVKVNCNYLQLHAIKFKLQVLSKILK